MFKTSFSAFVAILIPALVCGCVRDVKTESAASFDLQSGQTWAWVPEQVETWQQYKSDAGEARIHTHDAYVEAREEDRAARQERREEPVGPDRREDRQADAETMYDTSMEGADAGADARTLKREHKHIQASIEGELSGKGVGHVEGGSPTYYVAYYLFSGGHPVAPRNYAAYENRTDTWDAREDEDTLVIDIVDSATGQLLWTGSGVGNTRGGGNEEDRMRGVKEAVRHIMRDL